MHRSLRGLSGISPRSRLSLLLRILLSKILLTSERHLNLVELTDGVLHLRNLGLDVADRVVVDCAQFVDLLLVWNEILGRLMHLVADCVLHAVSQVSKVVILQPHVFGIDEDQGLEQVLFAVDFQDLLNEEVELLLLLVDQAWAEVFDPRVGHADLRDQEVEEHDLHDEDVHDEEEPRDANHGILVRIRQVAVLGVLRIRPDPRANLRLRQVTNRVPKRLQIVDDHREHAHELVALVRVVAFENVGHKDEDEHEGEEHDQERIDVPEHLSEHLDEEAEGLVVSDELQELGRALY